MAEDDMDMAQIQDGSRQTDRHNFHSIKSQIGEHGLEPFDALIIGVLRDTPRAQVARTREELLNSVVITDGPSGQHVSS